MSSPNYVLRDDLQYTVIVGWDRELESFFGCVFDAAARTGEPVAAVGQEPHEITAVSELAQIVGRFGAAGREDRVGVAGRRTCADRQRRGGLDVLLRVDPAHLASLVSHLVAQGFPASPVDEDGLLVLFPAAPALFPVAAELDDWAVRVGAEDAVRIES